MENTDYSNYMVNLHLINENEFTFDQRQLAFRLAKVTNNYLQFLKDEFYNKKGEPTQQLKDYYDEQMRLSKVGFKYMDEGEGTVLSDISYLSKSLSIHSPEEVLSADFIMNDPNYQIIGQFLDAMIDSNNLLILVGDA